MTARNAVCALAALALLLFVAPVDAQRPEHAERAAPEGEPGPMPPDGWHHDVGELGTYYPQPADVRFGDAQVNQDRTGGAEQTLHALAATPAGFAAVWRDTRHGNLGLFLGRMDREGNVLGKEQPVHAPRTSRQVEPAIAAGGPLFGAVAWFAMDGGAQQVQLRFFERTQGVRGPMHPLGTATGRNTEGGVARGDTGQMLGLGVSAGSGLSNQRASRAPALAFADDGTGIVVWREGGRLFGRPVSAAAAGARGEPFDIDQGGPEVTSDAVAAASPSGAYLVGWTRADGVAVWGRSTTAGGAPESQGVALAAGAGELMGIAATDVGWWLLVRVEGGVVLRQLDADLRAVGSDIAPVEGAVVAASLAAWEGGLLLATERAGTAESGSKGSVELHSLDVSGAPAGEPIALPGEGGGPASGPVVAARGDRAIVAWTDRRSGDFDVYYRVLGPGDKSGPDRRWNTDDASADQTAPAIASNGSNRAVIVWEDRRHGASHLYGRRLGPAGLQGDEFHLGADAALDVRSPAVAVGEDGGFAVTWFQQGERGVQSLVQLHGPDNKPIGPSLELGVSARPKPWRSSQVALAGGRYGVLTTVDRPGGEVGAALVVALVAPGVKPTVHTVDTSANDLRHPALFPGSDGGFVAMWDEAPRGEPAHLRGRRLGPDLTPLGETLRFHPSPTRTGDWDPAGAPWGDGGFALAWTGNESPTRDVFARFYDRHGSPASFPIAVSVLANEQDYAEMLRLGDGSYVVVWEDDISYRDHIQARRVHPDGSAGPAVTLNQRETSFVPDRTMPHAAVLGDSFAVVWSDRRRGLGHDVFVRILGPGFDRDLPPATVEAAD